MYMQNIIYASLYNFAYLLKNCNDMHTSVCCFDGLESVEHNTPIWIEFGLCRVNGLCCVNAAVRKYEVNVRLLTK